MCFCRYGGLWDRRVASWHTHVPRRSDSDKVLDRLARYRGPASDSCVDLGAGTGFVALALAPLAGSVVAFDISSVHGGIPGRNAPRRPVAHVHARGGQTFRTFPDPAASVDLVGPLCAHHLRDETAGAGPAEAAAGCPPGAAIVVADLMCCRGGPARPGDPPRKAMAFAVEAAGMVADSAKKLAMYGRASATSTHRTGFWPAGARRAAGLHRRALSGSVVAKRPRFPVHPR